MTRFPRKHLWLVLMVAVMGISVSVGWGEEAVDFSELTEIDGITFRLGSDQPFTGTAVSYWENGQEQEEAHFIDGLLDGRCTIWYESGQKKRQIEFSAGKKHGEVITWYSTGQKKVFGTLCNNRMSGTLTRWYQNGQIERQIEFRDGEKIIEKCWDEDGNPIDCE